MEKIDRLKSFIEHENKRFNSLKSAIVTFSSPALDVCAIGEEGEYSANPDDYFTVEDDHIFEDRYLTCMCEREGWIKKIIVKENPTKGDLKNWKELAEKVELE